MTFQWNSCSHGVTVAIAYWSVRSEITGVTLSSDKRKLDIQHEFLQELQAHRTVPVEARAKLYDTFNHYNRYIQTLNLEAS
jgi:hypothetical protein